MALGIGDAVGDRGAVESEVEGVDRQEPAQSFQDRRLEVGQRLTGQRAAGAGPAVNDGQEGPVFSGFLHRLEEATEGAYLPHPGENLVAAIVAVHGEGVEGGGHLAEAAGFLAVGGDGDSHVVVLNAGCQSPTLGGN